MIDLAEIYWAAKNSFIQAGLSALGSLVLGSLGGLGLLWIKDAKISRYVEVILLGPAFLPPLFSILALGSLWDFPAGLWNIVLVHVVMNAGLCSAILTREMQFQCGPAAEAALTLGSSKWQYLLGPGWRSARRTLLHLFMYVFVLSFVSFSVPLAVGGGRGSTLEILIYEKIRLGQDWSQAWILALLQTAVLFFLIYRLIQVNSLSIYGKDRARLTAWLGNRFCLVLVLLLNGLFYLGFFIGVVKGLSGWSEMSEYMDKVGSALAGTLWLCFVTGVFILLAFFTILFVTTSGLARRVLESLVAPSTSLLGFIFLVCGPNEGLWPFLKIPLCFTILVTPSLFRMSLSGRLEELVGQMQIAETLGASKINLVFEVLWPQLKGTVARLVGISVVWISGDFAVSRILAHRDLSLSLLAETFLQSYRLGPSTLINLLALLCGTLVAWVFVMMIEKKRQHVVS